MVLVANGSGARLPVYDVLYAKRGRAVTTWMRTLKAELKPIRISWIEAKHRAQDRTRWRQVVKALCLELGEED